MQIVGWTGAQPLGRGLGVFYMRRQQPASGTCQSVVELVTPHNCAVSPWLGAARGLGLGRGRRGSDVPP